MSENVTMKFEPIFTVEVPIEKGIELQTRHIDIQISNESRLKLSCMYYGLLKSGAKLKNGIRVTTAGHVVQWLLENLNAKVVK